jgi:hypothetical protein
MLCSYSPTEAQLESEALIVVHARSRKVPKRFLPTPSKLDELLLLIRRFDRLREERQSLGD